MPTAPDPITSTPDVPGQPYDATSEAPIGKWKSVDPESGPASFESGAATGDFPSGEGGWTQT
jgi:hypothetical protein